jgi:selenocysteine lyase/cysteine desulfurase
VARNQGGPKYDESMEPRDLFEPAPGTIYLDAATYGLPPRPTLEVMRQALADWQAGTADWISAWDRAGDTARERFAHLIGADKQTVALAPSASVGVGTLAASLGRGEEVVLPDDEFTSVLYPLLVAEQAHGVVVRRAPFERLAEAVGPQTRLVAFSLVQSQSGKTADLPSLLAAAERVGARTLVDATHAVPFLPVQPQRVDYLVCAAYKHLLCPRGVAFLYVRPERWGDVAPILANWRSGRDPYGHYYGGPLDLAADAARFDVSLAWFDWLGASVSLDLLVGWQREGHLERVRDLARRLASHLDVPAPISTVLSVAVEDAEGVRTSLAEQGIRAAVRAGSVRLAPHVYNTPDEIDRAAQALAPFVAPATAPA